MHFRLALAIGKDHPYLIYTILFEMQSQMDIEMRLRAGEPEFL